jgi:hypothetical protein
VIDPHKIEMARTIVQFRRRLSEPPEGNDIDVMRLAMREHADMLSAQCLHAKDSLDRLRAQGQLTGKDNPESPTSGADRRNF